MQHEHILKMLNSNILTPISIGNQKCDTADYNVMTPMCRPCFAGAGFTMNNKSDFVVSTPYLSCDIASGSKITPCNKIDKLLVVYRYSGNVMASITTFL